jgi:hypothetical protein
MAKKTAKKKTATKKAAKPKAKAKAKQAAKPKAKAKAKAKPTKPAAAAAKPVDPQIEAEVAKLLADSEAGNIDNAWDVIFRVSELAELLPKTSTLWKPFNRLHIDLGEICRVSEMGPD